MLVEVGVLCVVLSRTPEKCGAGERVLSLDSGTAATLTAVGRGELETYCGVDLEDALSRDLASVAEVRHVCIERADNNLLVWIALDNPSRAVRERVFQKELELIEGFPEIDFDFNVIPAKSRDPRQFASSAKLIYSREDDNGAN
jgi:hypothetical protein